MTDRNNLQAATGVDAPPLVRVKPMQLSDGRTDYFVSIQVGEREVTPHVFREEYKAAYHVALYDWLLNGSGEEPDVVEFGPDDWPALAAPPAQPAPAATHGKPDGAVQEALDSVGMFFRILRGPSYLAGEGYSLQVTKIEYEKARAGYELLRAALRSPKIAAAETSPGDVIAMKEACKRAVTELDCIYINGKRVPDDSPVDFRVSIWRDAIKAAETAIDRLDVTPEAKSQEPEAVAWRRIQDAPSCGGTYVVGGYIEDGVLPRYFARDFALLRITTDGPEWTLRGDKNIPMQYWHRTPPHPEYVAHPTTKPEAPAVSVDAIKDLVRSFHRNSCYPEAGTGELNAVATAIAALIARGDA